MKKDIIKIFLLLIIFSVNSKSFSQVWDGWRGLDKQACNQTSDPVLHWSDTTNVQWKANLEGEGHSSPVISEEYVFISSAKQTNSGTKFASVMLYLLLIIIIVTTTYSFIIFIKQNLLGKTNSYGLTHSILFSITLGLIVFIFSTLHWNYFHEKSILSDRMIANWLYSGASVVLLFILAILTIPRKSHIKAIVSLLIIPFVYFLLMNRPYPGYYALKRLLLYHNLGNFALTVQSVYLPLIAIIIFLAFYAFRKKTTLVTTNNKDIKSRNTIFISAFILGTSGFLIAPILSLIKITYRKYISGAPINIGFTDILDYTYPYLLLAVGLGFIITFYFQIKKTEVSKLGWKWMFPFAFIISVIFFTLVNFSSNEIKYERYITCFDRDSGELLWETKGLKGPAVKGSNYNSQATPTPVIKDGKVYAYFGSAGMMCVDFKGKPLWTNKNLPYTCIHGVGASPVKTSNAIIICNATPSAPYIVALNPETGDELWKSDLPSWKSDHGEYRTPTVIIINDRESIIEWNNSRNTLRFYDANTGEIYLKYNPKFRRGGETIVSPMVSSDTLILTNRMGIHALSLNKIINKTGNPTIWSTKLKGKGPDTSSPVKAGNRIYIATDNGYLSCVDSRNGDLLWLNKIGGLFYSSVISVNGYIYITDTKCTTTVLNNKAEFKVLSKNNLNEEINSTLAADDDQLFIRTVKSLWCISKK